MANYRYQALDATGRQIAGELEADNVQQAVAQLEIQGLTVQSIGYASATPIGDLGWNAPRTEALDSTKATPREPHGESREHAVLRAHMATILERGRAITPALRAYADELPAGRQRRQLLSVCRVLARGSEAEATAALADLPEYWIPLLSAATSARDPGHMLSEFLSESQRTEDLRQQWWLALAYPLVLAGLTLMVMLALSLFVIPEFGKIFTEFDLQLPGLTFLILSVASWTSSWGGMIFLAILAALAFLLLNANRLIPRSLVTWLSDWIRPPFGRRAAVARFARFLADLLDAGLSLPDALRIAGHCIQRARMRRAAWSLANQIELSDANARSIARPLSATVCHAIAADVPTPTRVHLLREISAAQADRVKTGLSWTNGLVEPAAICLVGMMVGLVVLGLFLPLIKLIEGLSG
jgi:type II secretory pathway component PulF